jgi:hypothetical protein
MFRDFDSVSPCLCVKDCGNEPGDICGFIMVPCLCMYCNCKENWFITPVYVQFQYQTCVRIPFDNPDFEAWMKIKYPEICKQRVYNRSFMCCCIKTMSVKTENCPNLLQYHEEYRAHLEYIPGSENYEKAREDFQLNQG